MTRKGQTNNFFFRLPGRGHTRLRAWTTPLLALSLGLLLAVLGGCEKKPDRSPTAQSTASSDNVDKLSATEAIWALGSETLASAHSDAETLRDRITAFLSEPNSDTLELARKQWHRAHNRYQQAAIFVAFASSNPGLFNALKDLQDPLDSWPLQPGYLDYFDVYTHSGIVNDIAVPITAKAIRRQHGFSDDSDVSLGYHAISFLLWGQDGQRPAKDYQAITLVSAEQRQAGLSSTDLPNNRRRALLKLLSELLIDDLERFHRHWHFAKSTLHMNYQALGADARLQLLQAAALALLDQLRDGLSAAQTGGSGADSPPEHNQFAGQSPATLASKLMGLQTMLEHGEPAVISWLLEESEQQQWQAQLEVARTQLAAMPGLLTNAEREQIDKLQQSLTAAAALLQPTRG